MPDRERVKYDIERCISHAPDACRDCSHYWGKKDGDVTAIDCMEELLAEAYDLLKEQDAHLLDISEIYTAHKLDVWIEEKGDNTVHTLMLVETEMTDKRQAAFFFPMIVRPVKAYGKTWRCWSARPTDEQRKAVKWE